MSYSYYVSPGSSNYSALTSRAVDKKPPLEKVVRWIGDKAANTVLDTILSRILAGPLYVRISASVTTGLITSLVIWIIADWLLPQLISNPTVAMPIVVGALAGAAMGGSRGLLVGAGCGWLVAILAESSTSELSKEKAEAHLNPLWVWCISTTIGGLAGWIAERLFDKLAEKFPVLGKILQAFVYLVIFVSIAVVLLRVGVTRALWWVPDIGHLQILIVGIVLVFASIPFYLWCYAPESILYEACLMERVSDPPGWIRVNLPGLQGLITAMLLTLLTFDTAGKTNFRQEILVIAALWTVPWLIITAGRLVGWLARRLLDFIAEHRT